MKNLGCNIVLVKNEYSLLYFSTIIRRNTLEVNKNNKETFYTEIWAICI